MKKRMPILISIIWILLIAAVISLIEIGKFPLPLNVEDVAFITIGLGILIPAYFCMLFSNARHRPKVLYFIIGFLYALAAIVTAVFSVILLLGEAIGNRGDMGPSVFAVCVSCIFGFTFTMFGTRRHGFVIDLLSMILPVVSIVLFSLFGDNIIFKIAGAVVAIIALVCFIPGTKDSSSSSSSSRNKSSSGMSAYELARQLGNTVHINADVYSTSGATAIIKISSLGYDYITQSDLDHAINFVKNHGCKQDVQLKYRLR